MKQSTSYLDCQQQLLDVIGRINRNSQDIEKGLAGKTDIILLVGDTGSGKSTVFNLLCGAKFEMIKEGHREILTIEKGTTNYSEMKHGTKSVTTQPIYHYIPEINHLLVDFPGFRDTRGEIEELVIQLLFNKIVTKNKVKIVYLIEHPLVDLPNRGTFIKEFLRIFLDQKFKFSESGLFLNKFSQEDVSESNLIANAKEQLFQITKDPEQKQQNIYVMRNIDRKRLGEIPKIREKILKEMVAQKPIKFKPYQIQRVEIISKYLQKTSKVLTDAIYNCFDKEIKNLVLNSTADVLIKVQVILRNFQPQKLSVVDQYQKLFQVYEELTIYLQSNRSVETSQNISFFKIYQYFYEFSEYIDGYMQCADYIKNIYEFMHGLKRQIEQKLASMNLEKVNVKKLKEQQAEFQQQYLQLQEYMKNEMIKVQQQEKQFRDEQIQLLRQEHNQQMKMLQKQLEESKKSKEFQEAVFKYILPIAFMALIKVPIPL